MYYCVREVKKTDKAAYCIALQTGLWSQRDFTHPVFMQIIGIYGTSEVKALNYCINGVSTIKTGNKAKNIDLFKVPRPKLIFIPDPKRFYGTLETHEGNVVCKCIYIRI